jgi:hypothetical protein
MINALSGVPILKTITRVRRMLDERCSSANYWNFRAGLKIEIHGERTENADDGNLQLSFNLNSGVMQR